MHSQHAAGFLLPIQDRGAKPWAVSCLLLLAAQFVAGVDGVEGWWIVPAPFLPALAWNIFKHGGSSDSKRLKSE